MKGIVGEDVNLTVEVSEKLGRAFAIWLSKTKKEQTPMSVAIGVDSRLTGAMLKKAFITGITNMGVDVYDCGLSSTPLWVLTSGHS